MTAAAAIAFSGVFTSCTHDDIVTGNGKIDVVENYETAFITRFGQPATDHTWGFGKVATAGTRSASSPSVPDIDAPYSADDITAYLATAKEPNNDNVADNWDNGYYEGASISVAKQPTLPGFNIGQVPQGLMYNSYYQTSDENKTFYNNVWKPKYDAYNNYQLKYDPANDKIDTHNAKIDLFWDLYNSIPEANRADWISVYTWPEKGEYTINGGTYHADETYVTNFKITGTWNGYINVAATEQGQGDPRTIVVTGTWNINDDNQKIGRGGLIVVANGGTINIAEGKTLQMVNQSRLVVLHGGQITGAGNIEVTNGTAAGMENYNGGEINITGYFNNNFGKFFNYGKLKCTQYRAGGQGEFAAFYNHGVVNINNGGVPGNYVSTNARIFNACQWYCAHDMRAYIIEMINGSYMYVGGQLEMSCGNDGSGDETYVSLAGGAYMQVYSLSNNNTNWYGPTDNGYAVVELHQIDYLNVTGNNPVTNGYFINNLAISVDDTTVEDRGTNNFNKLNAWYLNGYGYYPDEPVNFGKRAPNGAGNGNAVIVDKGEAEVTIPADEDFKLGESGCAPGYEGTSTRTDVAPVKIIAEDLSVDEKGDFDFNDVVFLVEWVSETEAKITLQKAGGTLPLVVGVAAGQEESNGEFHENEVHKRFNVSTGTMVNIGSRGVVRDEVSFNVSGTFTMDNFEANCNNIRVAVKKNGQWHELTAIRGKVPSKIAVAKRYVPCDERDDIETTYPLFPSWVENPSIVWY